MRLLREVSRGAFVICFHAFGAFFPVHRADFAVFFEVLERVDHADGFLDGTAECQVVDKLVLAVPPVIDPRGTAKRSFGGLWDENGLPLIWDQEQMKKGGHFVNPRPEWSDELNRSRAQGGKWTRIHSTTNAWYDMVARLPIIKPTATLVIMGEICAYNEIVDIMVFNLPNASKVIIPKTGNFLHVEDTKGFSSAVLDFLK